ncbi:MAG: murein biosynthesis integral membrane protein MurJ [Parachlamydiaceae bacterium]|nr:murein biosynthesis integral membrane protein MurJ [Parachlamydiaceae bacterium]
MEDTPKRMIQAAGSFFSGTMLSRISGMLRDIVMAFSFGTGASVAAFFVAFRFAHLLRRLFGEGALQVTFVPQFESLRNQESSSLRGGVLFIDLYVALTLILVLIISAAIGICGLLLNGYGGIKSPLALEVIYLCMLMLPSLLFISLTSLNAALLQCERNYFLPSVASVAFNAVWICGALVLHFGAADDAMPKLAVCIILACFCQWLVTVPKVFSILRSYGLWEAFRRSTFSINLFSDDLRKLGIPFLLGIVGIGAAQINSGCDALFASYADSSGPAYLWYAIRLQQLPLALFGIALSGALLPPLARAIKGGEASRSFLLLKTAIMSSVLLILPMTGLLFLLGQRSIALLYGYGDFGASSILGTTTCLWGYALGLLPMTLILVIAPIFYAKGEYRATTEGSVISMVLNLFFNGLFVIGFGWGASSVAVATSISSFMNVIYLIVVLERSMQKVVLESLKEAFVSVGKPSILASGLTLCVMSFVPVGESFIAKAVYLGELALFFGAVFAFFYFPLSYLRKAIQQVCKEMD